MLIYLIQGLGYGLAAASQPGPFQTYLISQTLTRGWKRTLPAALAPLVSDGPIILLCVLVLSQVPAWMQEFSTSPVDCLFYILHTAHTNRGRILIQAFPLLKQELSKASSRPR